ncbi:hypothetical protein V1517DRAFT_310692 [Lipomyces orientalis]|uniref:Uncharacterized protein n=1 Tax=Lipomyces orientalis TaxID=1233043 RepID=A0ACC3TF23_9ASCO
MHEATNSYYGDTFPDLKLRTPHDKTVYPEAIAAEPELTREFAYKAAKGEFEPSKVTVENVDQLANQLVMTEPDLIVLFGPKPDLDGFAPWQVRSSEIYIVFTQRGDLKLAYQEYDSAR